jgi:myo-inositol 2-dehydrogenase/D-chiro-inositol 1-dehydrogenase
MRKDARDLAKPSDVHKPMADNAPLSIGLVGCGRLAEIGYVPALKQTETIRLVAVADIDQSRCRSVAPECPAYDSIHSLIAATHVDGLIICTPTRFHFPDARAAAEAGIRALLEKPPGLNLAEARAIGRLHPPPWIGFNRRFDHAVSQLKAAVAYDDELQLELHYRRTSWKPFDMQDDALLDLAPHLVDLARWLTGTEISRTRALRLDAHRARLELKLDHRRAVVLCSDDSYYRERIVLKDSRGRARHIIKRGGLIAGIAGKLHARRENALVPLLSRQLSAFAAALRSEPAGTCLATAADGVAVMATLEAARRSAASNGAPWEQVSAMAPA